MLIRTCPWPHPKTIPDLQKRASDHPALRWPTSNAPSRVWNGRAWLSVASKSLPAVRLKSKPSATRKAVLLHLKSPTSVRTKQSQPRNGSNSWTQTFARLRLLCFGHNDFCLRHGGAFLAVVQFVGPWSNSKFSRNG